MTVDPIALQVTAGALRAACEEMGAVLVRAAHSREHQGAPRLLDRALRRRRRDGHAGRAHPGAPRRDARRGRRRARRATTRPGVSWVLNDPYAGGTHLPDITVVTPAFHDGELLGFAAARAHHADVGGRVPGLDARRLDARSTRRASSSRRASSTTPRSTSSPSRCASPPQRRADLRAQLAANRTGARRLGELADRVGADVLREATAAVLDYAERRTRACLAALDDGDAHRASTCSRRPTATSSCAWPRTVDGDELTLDFSGSRRAARGQPQLPAGRHRAARACSPCACSPTPTSRPAPAPTARSRVVAPEGSLLNARSPAAVAGGNVETSSRVADLVLGAFGRALGPGDDEQPHARHRRRGPTTRRSAAARARARTPTARAACTSRCPTRSTRRSRRSSSSSRCG